MIANPTIPTPIDPQLIDIALLQLQTELTTGLSWLTAAYGKAQRLIERNTSGKRIYFPGVYAGAKEYLKVFPDSHLGNFCFFEVPDGNERVLWNKNHYNWLTSDFGLIFWFDFRDVYPSPADWTLHTIENVKSEVLRVLTTTTYSNLSITDITTFSEQADNIYRSYTHNEISEQFLMRPYGGFRINGTMRYKEKCP